METMIALLFGAAAGAATLALMIIGVRRTKPLELAK